MNITSFSSNPTAAGGQFHNRAGKPDKHDRFRPSRNKTIWLHENDQEVLRLVDRCRFLDSRQLRLMLGRGLNERAFLRRLQTLFHAEYLERPEQQRSRWWAKGAAQHYVYALGIEGHKLLYPELHKKGASTDWRLRNRRAQALYIDHRLAVAEVMLSFLLAGEMLNVQMVAWHEGNGFHRATGLPSAIDVPTQGGSIYVPLHPDAYFVLSTSDGRQDYFFLEVDRGTEPISRATWVRTSIRRKLAAYWQLYADRVNERAGIPSFRVLTVTTSGTRVENMRRLARAIDPKQRGSAMFLFTTVDRISLNDPPPSLMAPIWLPPIQDEPGRCLWTTAS